MPRNLRLFAIVFMASSVSAFDYAIGRVNREFQEVRREAYVAILDGTAPSPYRYRILAPALEAPVIALAQRFMDPSAAFRRIDGAFDFMALMAVLLTLYHYLRLWFTDEQAIAVVMLIATTIPITLRQHFYAPYSLVEPSLLTLALIAVARKRYVSLLILTVLASLNRETGVLVPIALLIDATVRSPRDWKGITYGFAGLLLSALIFVSLRGSIGPGKPAIELPAVWAINVSSEGLRSAVGNVALFAGVTGWILAAAGFGRAPAFARRMLLIAVLYLPLYLVWGIWYEVRLLMPLYPLLAPLMAAALFQPRPSETERPRAVRSG